MFRLHRKLTAHVIALLCGLGVSLLAAPSVRAADPPATAPVLLPIPDAAAQAESLALLKRVFKDEYARSTPEQRLALAKALLQQATLDKNPPAMRYVMLRETAELASGAGDAELACRAADTMAAAFAGPTLEMKVRALTRAANVSTGLNQWEAITNLGLPLLDDTVREAQFALGQKLAQLIETSAQKTRHVDMVTAVQAHTAEFHTLLAAYTAAQAADTVLQKHPLDEAANLKVGTYTCFVRGDWLAGLLNLAQSTDESLKATAIKELAGGAEPIRELELADRWWDISARYQGWMQREIRRHSADWYTRAVKSLNGITLARINQRISLGSDAATQPFEKTVNLLALLDPAKDAQAGAWKMAAGALASDDTRHARLAFPYEPPDEYDLCVEFVVAQKGANLAVLLTHRSTPFAFALGLQSGRFCRFESINNHVHAGNPTEVKFDLRTDHKYILVLQVRNSGVKALVDGKLINEYKTDFKDLSRASTWKLPTSRTLGLGSSNGALVVYSADVMEIGGQGKRTR